MIRSLCICFACALAPLGVAASPEDPAGVSGLSSRGGATFAFECRTPDTALGRREVAEMLGLAPDDPRLAGAIRAARGKISLTDMPLTAPEEAGRDMTASEDPLDRLIGC